MRNEFGDPLDGVDLNQEVVDMFQQLENQEMKEVEKASKTRISKKLQSRMGEDEVLLSAVMQKVEGLAKTSEVYLEGQEHIKKMFLQITEKLSGEVQKFYNLRSKQLEKAREKFTGGIGEIVTLESRINSLEALVEKQSKLIDLLSTRLENQSKELERLAVVEPNNIKKNHPIFGGLKSK